MMDSTLEKVIAIELRCVMAGIDPGDWKLRQIRQEGELEVILGETRWAHRQQVGE